MLPLLGSLVVLFAIATTSPFAHYHWTRVPTYRGRNEVHVRDLSFLALPRLSSLHLFGEVCHQLYQQISVIRLGPYIGWMTAELSLCRSSRAPFAGFQP